VPINSCAHVSGSRLKKYARTILLDTATLLT
jgi:hypothetical protein